MFVNFFYIFRSCQVWLYWVLGSPAVIGNRRAPQGYMPRSGQALKKKQGGEVSLSYSQELNFGHNNSRGEIVFGLFDYYFMLGKVRYFQVFGSPKKIIIQNKGEVSVLEWHLMGKQRSTCGGEFTPTNIHKNSQILRNKKTDD